MVMGKEVKDGFVIMGYGVRSWGLGVEMFWGWWRGE